MIGCSPGQALLHGGLVQAIGGGDLEGQPLLRVIGHECLVCEAQEALAEVGVLRRQEGWDGVDPAPVVERPGDEEAVAVLEPGHQLHGLAGPAVAADHLGVLVHHLRSSPAVGVAGFLVGLDVPRLGWKWDFVDRHELAHRDPLLHQGLCHLDHERVEPVGDLLESVEELDRLLPLFTRLIARSTAAQANQAMPPHDLVQKVPTLSIMTPVVGLDQHGPGQRSEQLSRLHEEVLHVQELKSGDQKDFCPSADLPEILLEPATDLQNAVQKPATQLHPGDPWPPIPGHLPAVHHELSHPKALLRSCSRMPILAFDPVKDVRLFLFVEPHLALGLNA